MRSGLGGPDMDYPLSSASGRHARYDSLSLESILLSSPHLADKNVLANYASSQIAGR